MMKMMKKLMGLALVVSVFFTGIFASCGNAEEIFEAEYPFAYPMPDQADYLLENGEFDYDAYDKAYEKWAETDRNDPLLFAGDEQLSAYFKSISKEMLTAKDQKNKVISPVNIYLALSMLSEITDGGTRDEILNVLGADSIESLRYRANRIFLSVYKNDGQTVSVPASSVWLRNDMEYKKDALSILADKYFASSFSGEMGSDAYNQMIRKWLADQTGGLLKEQAEKISLDPETVIALASSLYFKAGWSSEFSKANTKTDIFHAPLGDVPGEFMYKSSTDTYYWSDRFGAVALPMTNGGRMWIVLPDEGTAAESLFESDEIQNLIKSPAEWENKKRLIVHKAIPKFDVAGENDLIGALRNLGVMSVFDKNTSDFSPLTDIPELSVSKVQHDARVKIDEEGVEAAAYTVITVLAASMRPPEEEMEFVADRPFAFVITSQDNLPLFSGIVNEPEK